MRVSLCTHISGFLVLLYSILFYSKIYTYSGLERLHSVMWIYLCLKEYYTITTMKLKLNDLVVCNEMEKIQLSDLWLVKNTLSDLQS